MIFPEESITPELAALLAAIRSDEVATAHTLIFMDDLLSLGRLRLVRFDAEGRLKLTPRGQNAVPAVREGITQIA